MYVVMIDFGVLEINQYTLDFGVYVCAIVDSILLDFICLFLLLPIWRQAIGFYDFVLICI